MCILSEKDTMDVWCNGQKMETTVRTSGLITSKCLLFKMLHLDFLPLNKSSRGSLWTTAQRRALRWGSTSAASRR